MDSILFKSTLYFVRKNIYIQAKKYILSNIFHEKKKQVCGTYDDKKT